METNISFHDSLGNCEEKELIEQIIRTVTDEVGRTYGIGPDEELSVLICNNEYIHELNATYRNIDRPTDVLSFALNEDMDDENAEGEGRHLLGDLIISIDKAHEQGEEYGHGLEREMAYLTVHGCLHILGYDHMEDEEKAEMRREEEYILEKLGYIREGQGYNE